MIDVHLRGGIGRDSATAHDIHVTVEGKASRLPRGSRYRCYPADGVGGRVEAERVGGVHHCATLVVRCASHVDDATYGGCGCIHDSFRRGHRGQYPLGTYGSVRIKRPYLVGRSYVDVEPAQDIHLVTSLREATW